MLRRISILSLIALFALAAASPVFASAPDFSPHIYANGQVWGTKSLSELPARNLNSFDLLFIFTNGGNAGQLPVADYAPGQAGYNGGRWHVYAATWSPAYLDSIGGTAPLIKSYAALLKQMQAGHLSIQSGNPTGGPTFFLCPLLPVK